MMSERRRRRSREEAGTHRRNQRQQQDNGLSLFRILTGSGLLRQTGIQGMTGDVSRRLFLPGFRPAVRWKEGRRRTGARSRSCRGAQQTPSGACHRLPLPPEPAGDT